MDTNSLSEHNLTIEPSFQLQLRDLHMLVYIGQDIGSALTDVSDPKCAGTTTSPPRENLAFKEPLARAGKLF